MRVGLPVRVPNTPHPPPAVRSNLCRLGRGVAELIRDHWELFVSPPLSLRLGAGSISEAADTRRDHLSGVLQVAARGTEILSQLGTS